MERRGIDPRNDACDCVCPTGEEGGSTYRIWKKRKKKKKKKIGGMEARRGRGGEKNIVPQYRKTTDFLGETLGLFKCHMLTCLPCPPPECDINWV